MSRCGQCKDGLACDKISGKCPGGCQVNFFEPLCQGKTRKQCEIEVFFLSAKLTQSLTVR